MFSQVRQALDSLAAALDGVDAASTAELREALGLAKPLRAKLETLETAVASQIARRERHGDGGAGVLHQIAAVPRSDAARNVRVAAELEQLPEAQSALADGKMCMANAARLARAARQTSADAVQNDTELVNLAKALPPDEFAHASQRWTAKHQSAADLAERHRRNRRNRNVRFWNGDDGTVQMRGAFDAEMGARIQARIRDEAERLRRADRRLLRERAAASSDGAGPRGAARSDAVLNGSTGSGAVRTRDQRMADALEHMLTHAPSVPVASSTTVDGNKSSGGTASGAFFRGTAPRDSAHEGTATQDEAFGLATPGHGRSASDGTTAGEDRSALGGTSFSGNSAAPSDTTLSEGHVVSNGAALSEFRAASGDKGSAGRRSPGTEIIVRADLGDLLDECRGMGEIVGTGPIPASVIDRLSCNADISIVLFGKELTPLYEVTAARAPTAAQRRALIARDGACIGCRAVPGECEAHHVIPWICGGPTRIDNLVLVCWHCHDRIHDHNWQVVRRRGRYRLVPPDATSPSNPAPSKKPIRRVPSASAHKPQRSDGLPSLSQETALFP